MIMGKGDCYEEKYNPDDRMEKAIYRLKGNHSIGMVICSYHIICRLPGVIEDHDLKTIVVIILDGAILVKSFRPVKNYLFTRYHCVPVFNQIFTKKELEELFEGESVSEMNRQYGKSFR